MFWRVHVVYVVYCIQATHIAQKSIVEADTSRVPEEVKSARVSDVLGLILPSNAVLHIAFPLHRYVHVCACVVS